MLTEKALSNVCEQFLKSITEMLLVFFDELVYEKNY